MNQHGHRAGTVAHLRQPGRIGKHRDGPAFDRVAAKARSVRRRAGQCGEQVAGSYVLGPQGDTGNPQIGSRAAVGGYRAHVCAQSRQRHARSGGGAQRSGHRHHLHPA
jgi:hypothetical protein